MLSVKNRFYRYMTRAGVLTSLLTIYLTAAFRCSNPNPLSNLFPDDTDLRGTQEITWLLPGDMVNDFTFYRSDGTTETLSSILAVKSGVVLYFTMWCPICETHMDYIRNNIRPSYPNVVFYLVDYVSGSVSDVYSTQFAAGYTDFPAAFDQNHHLTDLFGGTMSSTIVIDKNSIVGMNEDFKDGTRLVGALNALP